jgi:hypothetical protein
MSNDDYAIAAVRDALKDEDRPAEKHNIEDTFRNRAKSVMSSMSSATKRRLVGAVIAALLTLGLAASLRPPILKEERPDHDPVDAPLSIQNLAIAMGGAGLATFLLDWFMTRGSTL